MDAMPVPLPRLPTEAELSALDAHEQRLNQHLRDARAAMGRPPAIHELEGLLPDGSPILPGGIPDNPLAAGVAGVEERCEGEAGVPPLRLDWGYCPAGLTLRANRSGTPTTLP